MEDVLFLIGRIIVAIFYLDNARNHFLNLSAVAGYAGSKNVPMPTLAVTVSGLLLLGGALSFLLGFLPDLGVAMIVLFFLPVTFMMHDFWRIDDPQMKAMQRINFMKNMGLMGSALMFLAIPEPWAYSIGG